jgi:hypothetical protein
MFSGTPTQDFVLGFRSAAFQAAVDRLGNCKNGKNAPQGRATIARGAGYRIQIMKPSPERARFAATHSAPFQG